MLYKYTGDKLKINDDNIILNGDVLNVKFTKNTNLDGPATAIINSCTIINNRTEKEIPNSMNFYTERIKDLKPLGILDAGDIDEAEETVIIKDNVNHPSHYMWLKQLCGIEVIDITRHMDFDLGNAIKYILRCGHKEELGYSNKEKTIEDLKKAIFYINDKIEMISKE